MQALGKFTDFLLGGTSINEKVDEISDDKLRQPLFTLISDELKKSGNEDNETRYKKMLEMLLPESISKSNDTFNRLNTNINNNLLSSKIKQDKFFNAFKNVKWHIKSNNVNYNTVREAQQNLFNGADEDDKRTILEEYNRKYKKTLYLVCCNLIKNKELLDKLFSAIELSEKNSENMRMHKMYFEALMNYIVIKCSEGDVEIGNNIFKFSTKNSIFLSNINDAIDVVNRHIKYGQKAKLTNSQSKIEKEMIELFSLNDSNISLQDATADINDKALEDTEMSYVDVLEKRDNIITTIEKIHNNFCRNIGFNIVK